MNHRNSAVGPQREVIGGLSTRGHLGRGRRAWSAMLSLALSAGAGGLGAWPGIGGIAWMMVGMVGMVVVGGMGGCAKQSEESRAPEEQASPIHKDLYTVRGEIRALPDPAEPASELMIRHESIAHFRGPGGRLGMNTMTMPFPLAEGVSLEGISVGDAVEFTFEVDFDTGKDRPSAFRLTEIRRLPEGTTLEFTPLPRKEGAGS